MGATQSSVQRCLVVLRVNDSSRCFPHLSPFVHAIVKYNSIPIQSEDDIKKMAAQRHLDLEVLDLINGTTKSLAVATPLGIGVKFCVPRLLELKVLEVEQGSPAEKRIAEGDFVVGIENFYFETNDEFFYAIYRNRGTLLNFIVYREGQVRRVPIKLNTCEPFLGAVFGEGILMTTGRSGNVVNIGTQSECQVGIGGAVSEDAGEMQHSTEKAANGILQNAESEAPGDSNVKHSQAECTKEQARETKKESSADTELHLRDENPQETEHANMAGNSSFSGANDDRDVNEAPCDSETLRRNTPIGDAACSEHADAACSTEMHGGSLSEPKDDNSISASEAQQPGIFMEHTDSQPGLLQDGNEVSSEHANGSNEVSLGRNQATSADDAHLHSNLETTPEENAHTCPIVGEYSNEDKMRLLETLTGAKKESMSEED